MSSIGVKYFERKNLIIFEALIENRRKCFVNYDLIFKYSLIRTFYCILLV